MPVTVLNFYKFADLADPAALRDAWGQVSRSRRLLGTVLIAAEGVNVALSGEGDDLAAFVAWVRLDARFADVDAKWSSGNGQPFKRLEVRVKPWIIRFAEAGDPTVPAIRSGARLAPAELRSLLEAPRPDVVIVDTRNDYETEHGHFAGAACLPIRRFTEFPAAFAAAFAGQRDKMLVFYCTGGIRCEKAVAWAAARGWRAAQLDGGILGYFKAEGGRGFDGRCFVFDDRWLVDAGLGEAEDTAVAVAAGAPRLQPKPVRN